jgi:hypothetical protein
MTAPSGQAALANARDVDTYPPGYCQKYVRSAWRVASLYGSAIDAWYGAVDRHPGDRTPPLGAPLYYEGGQYGHVVINTVADTQKMRGTDMLSSGVVSEDVIGWIENHWGYRYLGWTGDINGVDLPLGNKDDEMNDEDFKRIRNIVREEMWEKQLPVDKPDGSQTKKAAGQMLREILQRLQK